MPDGDVSWVVVAGRQVEKKVDDIGEADTVSDDSENWHPDDDFEEIDDSWAKMESAREGTFRRCPTTTKEGPDWLSVYHRTTENADTGEILEDIQIDCHAVPGLWRRRPRKNMSLKVLFLLSGISL